MNTKITKIISKEILILILISLVTLIVMFISITSLIPDIFIGKYDIKWEIQYFKDTFNHYSFIFSYPAIFVPYILFSIFRIFKLWISKHISSRFIRNISSIIITILICVLITSAYRAIWYKTEDIFFQNRDRYFIKSTNVIIDNSNYKDFKWEGGYHGVGDPFYYGSLTFNSDSLAIWTYGLYNGRYWDFPLRYFFKYPNYKEIDTFLVVEDTVILYKGFVNDYRINKKYKVTAIDIFEINANNLTFDPTSPFLYPDSLNKTYFQMHNR